MQLAVFDSAVSLELTVLKLLIRNTQKQPTSERSKQWLPVTGFCFPAVHIDLPGLLLLDYSQCSGKNILLLAFSYPTYFMPSSEDDLLYLYTLKTISCSPENKIVVTLLYFTFFLGFLFFCFCTSHYGDFSF